MARELGETSLMLLVHPTLDSRDMEETVAAIRKVLRVATLERPSAVADRPSREKQRALWPPPASSVESPGAVWSQT